MSRLGDVQGAFEAMPAPNQPVRVEVRNALARALRPDFVGINPADYLDVTDEMLDLAAPEALRTNLIGVKAYSSEAIESVIINPDTNKPEKIYVAVTPLEFGLMSGSIQHLGERAVAQSKSKRQTFDGRRSPIDAAAAVRAGIHSVTTPATAIEAYLKNNLDKQNQLIAKFQEAAKYPGLARFGNEGTMREQLTYLRTYVFGGMLTTIGNQRDWNSNNHMNALKSINARIFLERTNNQHIENFKGMLDLAAEWNGHKLALLKTRQWNINKYVKQHEPNAQPLQ